MKDVGACRRKVIKHMEKEIIEHGLTPIDKMYDYDMKDGKYSIGNDDFWSLDLVCQYGLGDFCCKFLDATVQKRSELKRALTEEDLNKITDDIIKNAGDEEKEKLVKFKEYLNSSNHKKSDKRPMYPDSEAADEALAH